MIINSVIKGGQPVIDTLNVTPSTTAQQITAPQGTDGYSPVNVSAVTSAIDANIVAGNIKNGVSILGVTGNYGGVTPTGTLNITSNGTHDVSSYQYADVNVPTTAPAYYVEKTKDANGVLQNGTSVISTTGLTGVGDYVLTDAYYQSTITGAVSLSILTCNGAYGCSSMFYYCPNITSVDLSSLYETSGNYSCGGMFNGCTSLTNVNLSNLTKINGQSSTSNMFANCTGLTSIDLSSLVFAQGRFACQSMFNGCSNLASVNISRLAKLGSNNHLQYMFRDCTSLTELRFSGLPYTAMANINSSFSNTLFGVTGCTVHFPSDWQTVMSGYSNITNGLGGTNTTVLFDLPSVTTLDMTNVTEVCVENLFANFGNDNYYPNVTSVNLSNLTTVSGTSGLSGSFAYSPNITSVNLSALTTVSGISGCNSIFRETGITGALNLSSLTTVSGQNGCASMFYGCTGITSVNLSSLTTISGSGGCFQMFYGCTGLTSVDLSSLTTVSGMNGCQYMFYGCTGLTELRFPSLITVLDANVFNYMLEGVTGCTVHFPSNLSSYNFSCGGTNTTVLYDLPATA